MRTAGPKVGFICVAPAHLSKNGAVVDHITVRDSDWAYCPSDVRGDGHDWKATGGISVGEVEMQVRSLRETSTPRAE